MDRLPSNSSHKFRRVGLWTGMALAALACLAVAVSAQVPSPAPGTGQQIFQDAVDDAGSGTATTLDLVRLGGTTTSNRLNFWFAVASYCGAPSTPPTAPCPATAAGSPHKPVAQEYQSTNPGYYIRFQVAGGTCYYVNTVNTANTNTFTPTPLRIWNDPNCTPSNPGVCCTAAGVPGANLPAPRWVCNEVNIEIPLSAIGNPTPGTVVTIMDAATLGAGGFYDQFDYPTPPALYTYAIGQNGPTPAIAGLAANFQTTAGLDPRVELSWTAPTSGPHVTGYRIERRMVAPNPETTWTQLASYGPAPAYGGFPAYGPMGSPPTTYTERPAPSVPGTYEYRVTALHCGNLAGPAPMPGPTGGTPIYSVGMAPDIPFQGSTAPALATVSVPAWPGLVPRFDYTGPGVRTNEQDVVTACEDSRIHFFDRSTTQYPNITYWRWDFGDSSSPAFTQNATHLYRAPGIYTVTLTVRDSQPARPMWPLAQNGTTRTYSYLVHSLGDPDCCPTISPVRSFAVMEGETIAFRLSASFPTNTTNATRNGTTFMVEGSPPLPPHEFNKTSGQFKWVVRPGQSGLYELKATAVRQALLAPVHPPSPHCESTTTIGVAIGATARTIDSDMDGIADYVDVCASVSDHRQLDSDQDGVGDACDKTPCGALTGAPGMCPTDGAPGAVQPNGMPDRDRDGIADQMDNCATQPNSTQRDSDNDLVGDVCDADLDGDGVVNTQDNCALKPNREQLDTNQDGVGDACPEGNPPLGAIEAGDTAGLSAPVGRESTRLDSMGLAALAFAVAAMLLLLIGAWLKKK